MQAVPMCVPRPDDGQSLRLWEVLDYSLHMAMLRLSSSADAQDIAQEVVVRYWLAQSRMYNDNWRSWVYVATRNAVVERIRRSAWRIEQQAISIEQCREMEDSKTPVAVQVSGGPVDPADLVEVRLFLAEALAEMNRLGDVYRRALVYEMADMSMREVACKEVIPIGTVKSRLTVARQSLRRWRDRQMAM